MSTEDDLFKETDLVNLFDEVSNFVVLYPSDELVGQLQEVKACLAQRLNSTELSEGYSDSLEEDNLLPILNT